MTDPKYSIHDLLKEDPRYKLEAYEFVREALSFGQNVIGMGNPQPTDEASSPMVSEGSPAKSDQSEDQADAPRELEPSVERHVTGQQLCEAIRKFALDQYGYMSKVVLNSWGVHETGDFGEIVFNLIRIGKMKRSESDQREDFDNVYNFDKAFQQRFEITKPRDE